MEPQAEKWSTEHVLTCVHTCCVACGSSCASCMDASSPPALWVAACATADAEAAPEFARRLCRGRLMREEASVQALPQLLGTWASICTCIDM
eukprot:1161251-Pelagomonas_calceolata.AAC.8